MRPRPDGPASSRDQGPAVQSLTGPGEKKTGSIRSQQGGATKAIALQKLWQESSLVTVPSWSQGWAMWAMRGEAGTESCVGRLYTQWAIPHIQKGPHADQTTSSLKKLEASSPDHPGLILGSFPQFC